MRAPSQSFLKYPLSTLFSSPANIRVLRELAAIGSEMTATELVDRTRLSKPSVLASLDHMAALGFVDALGSARQRLYRMNNKHPLCTALTESFTAEQHRFGEIMSLLVKAGNESGAVALWVYGSVPRGDDRPDSDLDIALVIDGDVAQSTEKMRERLRDEEDRLLFSASVIGLGADDIIRLAVECDPFWLSLVEEIRLIPLIGPPPEAMLAKIKKRRNAA